MGKQYAHLRFNTKEARDCGRCVFSASSASQWLYCCCLHALICWPIMTVETSKPRCRDEEGSGSTPGPKRAKIDADPVVDGSSAFHVEAPTEAEAEAQSKKTKVTDSQRKEYARRPGPDYQLVGRDAPAQHIVKDLVYTLPKLLEPEECAEWIAKAEAAQFEEGDFVFKVGYVRENTGGKRDSATMVAEDEPFSQSLWARMKEHVPQRLPDGREVMGISNKFLVSRYRPKQYFAPHFDGSGLSQGKHDGGQSAATIVLYLTDDFEGGATHYLPGPGSEVPHPVAVTPARGAAVVHRSNTVMHCGGEVESGTKYIMQVGLIYTRNESTPPPSSIEWAVK